jgi:hypothetical protein
MTVEQIKEEVSNLPETQQDQLVASEAHARRQHTPGVESEAGRSRPCSLDFCGPVERALEGIVSGALQGSHYDQDRKGRSEVSFRSPVQMPAA